MNIGIVAIPRRLTKSDPKPVHEQLLDLAQITEELKFRGLWVTDSLGRGATTVDPLVLLGHFAAATKHIELGTCVLQLPLRHPVELAHRVQSVNLLSNARLRLGIGSGSTQADFDAVEANYEGRFKALPAHLEIMQRVWAEQSVFGPPISVWPGTEGGPPVLLGAWRSERWINLAANQCSGWMASGIHSSWEDLEIGIKMYRQRGGERAVLANVFTDLTSAPMPSTLQHSPKIHLHCDQREARERLQRVADLGFDDVLLVPPSSDRAVMEQIRSLG